MQKLDYKELLNQNAIYNWYIDMLWGAFLCFNVYVRIYWNILLVAILFILSRIPLGFVEKKRIENTILLYNDYVETNTFSLVEDEFRDIYSQKARNLIFYKYSRIWECEFVYEDEDQVYKSHNGDVYIANGYFKDMSGKKDCKVKYSIIFKDNEQYMSNIDNLVLLNYKKSLPTLYYNDDIYNGPDYGKLVITVLLTSLLVFSYIEV